MNKNTFADSTTLFLSILIRFLNVNIQTEIVFGNFEFEHKLTNKKFSYIYYK